MCLFFAREEEKYVKIAEDEGEENEERQRKIVERKVWGDEINHLGERAMKRVRTRNNVNN
jgi:hypothetical protein